MARLVRAATDRNPPTLGGGGCQESVSGVKFGVLTIPGDAWHYRQTAVVTV